MKNLHILTTDKASRVISSGKEFNLLSKATVDKRCKNIYITNDEEIKEGDWVYCTKRKLFGKVVEIQLAKFILDTSMLYFEIDDEEIWCKLDNCKKIILTDNKDLIKDGVQAIDDEFLEWFVKNPSCEEVKVDLYLKHIINQANIKSLLAEVICKYNYKIIIPKEECKKHVEFINDNIEEFDKAIDLFKKEDKQECKDCSKSLNDCTCIEDTIDMKETLEEAAENYSKQFDYAEDSDAYSDFINGAKWQQERMYSEEEVKNMINDFDASQILFNEKYTYKVWFEQFKKK